MKKILSFVLLTIALNSSFAQTNNSWANPSINKNRGTYQQNRSEQPYERSGSTGPSYAYGKEENRSYNGREIDNRNDRSDRNSDRNNHGNYDRRDEREVDVRRENHGYPERRDTKGKDLKAFGGGLILGGILGILIGSAH